jgi:hypothetical protein
MYSDKFLEFSIASRDAAATTTKALPMGQRDLALTPDTAGMGPYGGLFIFASAGEDLATGFVITMQHADLEAGPFTTLITFPATTAAKAAGEVLVKHPVPFNVKNWVRFTLSTAKKVNILMTLDVEKPYPGLFKE